VPPPVAAIASLPPPAVPPHAHGSGLLPAPLPIPTAPAIVTPSPAAPAVAPLPQTPSPPQQPLPQQPALPPQPAPSQSPPPAPAAAPASGKPTDAITIASFNIQVFGESKVAKPQVVDVLARVVRGCDIVAIQEVRAKSDHVIPQFLEAVNADGSRYQFVIGPRLGRTASKEQYVFMYDTNRIEIDPSSVGTAPNPGDKLHRPPMFARFRVRTNPPESGFSFWLVDIHTDPDEVPQEVDALADVFVAMRTARPDEDDVILLGDLNAGPPQFGRLGQIPGIGWAVSGVTTNTRRTKTYDNIIFDRNATSEYTGRWGVLDLQNTFGLSLDKALEVSDHNPVWACFRPFETQRTGSLPATAAPQ
jgi:endonuclease/exonuclease/phosphatase family metal-dependent hydrolase